MKPEENTDEKNARLKEKYYSVHTNSFSMAANYYYYYCYYCCFVFHRSMFSKDHSKLRPNPPYDFHEEPLATMANPGVEAEGHTFPSPPPLPSFSLSLPHSLPLPYIFSTH